MFTSRWVFPAYIDSLSPCGVFQSSDATVAGMSFPGAPSRKNLVAEKQDEGSVWAMVTSFLCLPE